MDFPLGNPRKTFDPDSSVCHFFDAAPGALKGHLSTVELVRITLTAMAAGGGILGLFQAVLVSLGTIFPAPTDAALAAVVLTFILEALRRLGHGRELAPDNASGMCGRRQSNAPWHRN